MDLSPPKPLPEEALCVTDGLGCQASFSVLAKRAPSACFRSFLACWCCLGGGSSGPLRDPSSPPRPSDLLGSCSQACCKAPRSDEIASVVLPYGFGCFRLSDWLRRAQGLTASSGSLLRPCFFLTEDSSCPCWMRAFGPVGSSATLHFLPLPPSSGPPPSPQHPLRLAVRPLERTKPPHQHRSTSGAASGPQNRLHATSHTSLFDE